METTCEAARQWAERQRRQHRDFAASLVRSRPGSTIVRVQWREASYARRVETTVTRRQYAGFVGERLILSGETLRFVRGAVEYTLDHPEED